MMYAAIDIGTNTVLLLVAGYKTGNKLNIVYEDQRIPRLGKGVDKNRNLHSASTARVIEAIRDYRTLLADRFPEVVMTRVTATSAVRDAGNRDAFVEQVFRETGIRVSVLSGKQEAEYTFLGALSVLRGTGNSVLVLDIGGGSTEAAAGRGYRLSDRHSFDIGSVRFTERYLGKNPPSEEDIDRCRASVRDELEQRRFRLPDHTVLIGVAGTVTSLAHMVSGRDAYDSAALNGSTLTAGQVHRWTEKVKNLSSSQLLAEYPEVMRGRADVFLAGLLILEEFMKMYEFKELIISAGGIRHGTILNMAK